MSDIVDTSPLGIERTERIAGDDALNSRLDTVTTELQGTQASVTTEVLHRSEGDLVIQRLLEGYIQDLLEGKAEDFERYIEFQNSQNLNYADVRNFVSSIRASLADEIRDLSTSLMNNLQANDARYDKLVSDVGRYLEILSDITLDSNQITLDNGELRAGAWTILSQARAWDLEIISRLNGLSESVGDSLKDAVEEIQNQLPSTEETITKAIEELSKSPIIKELSDLLNQSIENDIAYELALLEQARKHANEMAQLAEDMRAEALAKAQEMEDYMAGEVTARITEVNKEVAARKEAIDLLTEDILTRVDQDKADFQADMLTITNRIKSAEDGLTSEIQHRKDGDSSTLNALNTYKVSNDAAITGLSTSLSSNVTKTNANTTLITGLTSRLDTAESGIESATTAAADAMSKATTAVSANSALSLRVDALAASITESEGTVVDVNAFNALKAEVNTVKGVVTGLVEDVTALESNYTTVNNKVTSQGTAISTLNTKMATAENSISQSANDITLLKTDISKVNAGLLTKVDSQAFSQLSSDVTELDSKYTTQASLVTDLRGSLDTTNVNVGKATSAAQNALTAAGSKGKVIFGTSAPATADRLSQNLWIDTTGGANTPKRWNGSAWVVVTDKVATDALAAANAASNLAKTKADTSAFNSLDQKVTVMDGKVSTNTNSITSLNGKIAIVEGSLATKLDSSALVNYYTKQQADDKALSTAAGKIEEFKATLGGSGVNLFSYPMSTLMASRGTWGGSGYAISRVLDGGLTPQETAYKIKAGGASGNYIYSGRGDWKSAIEPVIGNKYILSMYVKSPIAKTVRLRPLGVTEFNGTAVLLPAENFDLVPDTWTRISILYEVTSSSFPYIGWALYHNYDGGAASDDNYVLVTRPMLERTYGTTATPSNWVEGGGVSNQVNANATAIENTNSEVVRVDGKTIVNANNISGLTSRMGTVEGQVSTKADASALQNYYTKTEADGNATTVAAGEVSKYDASLVIGGTNLVTKSNKNFRVGSVASSALVREILADGSLKLTSNNLSGSSYLAYWVGDSSSMQAMFDELVVDNPFTVTLWFKAVDPQNLPTTVPTLYFGRGLNYLSLNADLTQLASGKEVAYTHTRNWSGLTSSIPHLSFSAAALGGGLILTKWKVEKGSKSTDWTEAPQDTQDQIDANATAIENTNAEVARVDGRVTTESNRITTLSGRVSTVEGGLTTKADVSAVNALTTRVGTVEGGLSTQANNTTALEAKIDSRNSASLIPDYYLANHNDWESHYGYNLANQFTTTAQGNIGPNIFFKRNSPTPDPNNNWNYSKTRLPINKKYRLSMLVRGSSGAEGSHHFTGRTFDSQGNIISYLNYNVTNQAPATGAWRLVTAVIDWTDNAAKTIAFGFAVGHTGDSSKGWWMVQGFSVKEVITADDADDTLATTTALNSTNTEVSRINGVVEGHSTDLTNLTASISGKADASALSELTVRVTEEEAKSTSQATSITNLTSSLSDTDKVAKDALPKVGGAGSFKTFKEVLNYHLSTSGTSSNIVIQTPITFAANMFRISGKGYNYASTKSVIDFEVSGYAYQSTGTILQHGAKNTGTFPIRIRLGMKNGKLCVILSPQGTNFAYPALTLDAAVSYGTVPDTFQDGWSASPIAEASLASSGITAIMEPSLLDVATEVTANASALSTLDTKVEEVDGIVSTQAAQLIVLTSDNNANKNALTVQGKVIDGVKSSYMVKMETNGVIGGFGLIQSTGALGQVQTSFGVNADSFFIGAPASKKQPFIVTTTNQVVNGVTYPAGTYIDVALIANATIGTAHIADASITNAKIKELDAAKITTGTLDAKRIRIGSTSQFDTGYAPTDVLNDAKSYVDSNTGNLVNNPSVSGTRERWSSGTVTTQDFLGTEVPVLTLTSSGNLQVNCDIIDIDPAKAYEISVWVKKSVAVGSTYLGLIARNAAGSTIAVNSVNQSGETSLSNNFYHWSVNGGGNPLDWIKLVAYLMPAGTDPLDMKKVGNVTANAFMLPNTRKLQMRVLNYYNGGTSTTAWFANPKIVEVDPNAVISASKAQILADSKTQTFTAQPTTPYARGDIYRNGSSIYVCTTSRASGSYVAADWILVGDVTANNTAADANKLGGTAASTVVNNAAKGIAVYNDVMSDLKITPVEKTSLNTEWTRIKAEYTNMLAHATSLAVSTTTYTSAFSALNSTSPTMTSILSSMTTTTTLTAAQRDALRTQFTNYYAQVTALNNAINDKIAANAKAQADAKAKSFTSQPVTPYTAGDLWRNGSTIRVCTVSRTSGSYVAADWTLVGDVTSANTAANSNQLGGKASATILGDITSAKNAADAAATQLTLWKYPNTTEIDGGKIRTNTVTANQINVANLSSISANLGTIKVGSANIADLAVKTANIDNMAITSAKIGDLQVDTLKIKDQAVTVSSAASANGTTVSITVATSGGKVRIEGASYYQISGLQYVDVLDCKLYRNNVQLNTWKIDSSGGAYLGDIENSSPFYWFYGDRALPIFVDTPPAGTHVYKIVATRSLRVSIGVMEVKK